MQQMEWKDKFSELEREKIVVLAKKSLRKEEGKEALEYLKNRRGFSDEVIEKFEFGYCPKYVYHQLSGRIITPIYNIYGDLIALSSRHLDMIPNRFWHESYDKGENLYGLFNAKQHILKYQKAIIVEGEFDVAALHTNGFPITVGVCGSAFTLYQASILSRYCSEVYLIFDGDDAGKKAIKRSMNMYYSNNLDSYKIKYIPVFLPEGYDPDDFIAKFGREELKKMMKIEKNKNILK